MKLKYRILYTPHLILRRPFLTDVDDLYICTSNPNVCKYEGWFCHGSNIDTLNFVNNLLECYESGICADYVLEEKDSGRAIGIMNLHDIDFSAKTGYVGYWLAEDRWNKGFATEALSAFLRYFFTKLGIKEIKALCHPANIASEKLLRKAGFSYTGEKSESLFEGRTDGTYCRTVHVFRLTRNEYYLNLFHSFND